MSEEGSVDAKIASIESSVDAKIASSITKAFEDNQFREYRKMGKETAAEQMICSYLLKEHIKSISRDSTLKSELKRNLADKYPHLGGEVEDLVERGFRSNY